MTRHILRLIWNRRRSNALITFEIFLSFLVLFALGSLVCFNVGNYLKPLGFTHDNVLVVYGAAQQSHPSMDDAEMRMTFSQIGREIRSCPEVVRVSTASTNLPYGRGRWGNSLKYDDRSFYTDLFYADDDFAGTLDITPIEGRWFNREDDGARLKPIVINRTMREAMFGSEPALGKIVKADHEDFTVVGVIDTYRYAGEFSAPQNGYFIRNVMADTGAVTMVAVLVKVRDGVGVAFEEQLMKRLRAMVPGWTFRIDSLNYMRTNYLRDEMLVIVLFFVIAGFLMFNVALGLFGVLWYSINRRRAEIGLRCAVGADARGISGQILGESLMTATLGIALGLFFAIQVPLTGFFDSVGLGVYLLGMLAAAALIYCIVTACAVYPSRLAARIQPAEALRNE